MEDFIAAKTAHYVKGGLPEDKARKLAEKEAEAKQQNKLDLFSELDRAAATTISEGSSEVPPANDVPEPETPATPKKRSLRTLLKQHPAPSPAIEAVQPDFFSLVFQNFSMKSDMEGMEVPIFSLSTKKDVSVWTWASEDGKKSVTVAPSAEVGRATMHDKDILIYCVSQLVEGAKQGLQISKRVRFVFHDFLTATHRGVRQDDYERAIEALKRLKGTNITIKENGRAYRGGQGFGLIDSWQLIEKEIAGGKTRMIAVEVVLSDRLYDSIKELKVLTLNPDYFRLRSPAKRRLYEIARKHCGDQATWKIGLEQLQRKMGSTAQRLSNFKKSVIVETEESDDLPDYRVSIKGDQVVFRPKDQKKLAQKVLKGLEKPC